MQFLSLPSGVFLVNSIQYLKFDNISILSVTCKEANRQSDEWKRAFMAREGIHASIASTRAVWQSFYCTRVPQDEMTRTTSVLVGIINTYVTSECAMLFTEATNTAPMPEFLSWQRDRETFLHQALQKSGLMSSMHGRRLVQVFLLESKKLAVTVTARALENDDHEQETEDQATANQQPTTTSAQIKHIIKNIPLMLHDAFLAMAHIVLDCFVVDEEKGVVGI